MRQLLVDEGLQGKVQVASAGTAAYHVGERPDPRSRAAAQRRGIEVDGQAARFKASDFARFDFVLAMDQSNFRNLEGLAKTDADRSKLSLLRDFDPESPSGSEVPDPYYGGERGFDDVLDICSAACRGLLNSIRSEL